MGCLVPISATAGLSLRNSHPAGGTKNLQDFARSHLPTVAPTSSAHWPCGLLTLHTAWLRHKRPRAQRQRIQSTSAISGLPPNILQKKQNIMSRNLICDNCAQTDSGK